MRLGLCCTFLDEPIKFRTTTVRYSSGLPRRRRRELFAAIGMHNVAALEAAVRWCAARGVGAFRVTSDLFPVATHPIYGYRFGELPLGPEIHEGLARVGALAAIRDVRLSFHPDQFVVPGSPTARAARHSLVDLEWHAEVGALLGAAQMTIHGGGAQGGKAAALGRLRRGVERLSPRARAMIALENDDRVYTVEDLLPLCAALAVPLVYDVHHHRCNPDRLSIEEATALAAATWGGREPWAHLSSPRGGWKSRRPREHADYIDPGDVPRSWLGRWITVDVEAKAKERAVLRFGRWVRDRERKRRDRAPVSA